MAATANDGPFHSSYSSLTAVTGNRYQNEPRELNDDELMAADGDGDQLLVFGVPTGSRGHEEHVTQLNRNSDAVWKMLQQQQNGKQPTTMANGPEVLSGANGGGDRKSVV